MPTVIFGSAGVGEIVQYSALIKRVSKTDDVRLAITEWQLPFFKGRFNTFGFGRDDYKLFRDRGVRKLNLSTAAAQKLGLFRVAPKTHWMFPLGDEVYINGNPLPNKIARVQVRQEQQSITERILAEYGYDNSDLEFQVATVPYQKNSEPTIAIGNSAEPARRLPIQFMNRIMKMFKGVRFIFLGTPYFEHLLQPGNNEIEFRWSSGRDQKTIERCYEGLLASDLVLGTDCGWTYLSLANYKPTLIVQTRIMPEALTPKEYWNKHLLVDRIVAPTCDRACNAQMLMRATGAGDELAARWFDPSLITNEYREEHATYPKSLRCFKTSRFDCMAYTETDFNRLIEKILRLKPELGAFRV